MLTLLDIFNDYTNYHMPTFLKTNEVLVDVPGFEASELQVEATPVSVKITGTNSAGQTFKRIIDVPATMSTKDLKATYKAGQLSLSFETDTETRIIPIDTS